MLPRQIGVRHTLIVFYSEEQSDESVQAAKYLESVCSTNNL